MRYVVTVVDSISEWIGKITRWACLVLVLALCFEVTARYAFNKPTIWSTELSTMLGATIIVLGLTYVSRHNGHVRIDIFYSRLSPTGKAIIDVACGLFLFCPLIIMFIYTAFSWMCYSWSVGEKLIETYWYPPAGPIRTVVFLGFCFFALQEVTYIIRDLGFLIRRNKGYD